MRRINRENPLGLAKPDGFFVCPNFDNVGICWLVVGSRMI